MELSVNIDHVATLRESRKGKEPDVLEVAYIVSDYADGVTFHLREDRRHIQDKDVELLCALLKHKTTLNLECACTEEMIEIALKNKPHMVTFVPEKREELTTEGGLTLTRGSLINATHQLQKAEIRVSWFVDSSEPTLKFLEAISDEQKFSLPLEVELHTGRFSLDLEHGIPPQHSLNELIQASQRLYNTKKIKIHAGHGLNRFNVKYMKDLKSLHTLNIGHSIIGRSVRVGMIHAIEEIKEQI